MSFYTITAGVMLFLQLLYNSARVDELPVVSLSTVSDGTESHEVIRLEEAPLISRAPVRKNNDSLGVDITARSAFIIDQRTGAVLWQKNHGDQRPVASITKLVSLMVISDTIKNLNEYIVIQSGDYSSLGYNNFSVGEQIRLRDLFAAAIIASDNTATRALARATGLSNDEFVLRMNEKVSELGLSKTHFVDPTGISSLNVSTAEEVLVFAQRAFSYENIGSLAGRKSHTISKYSGKSHTIRTTNELVGSMISVIAAKTGFVTDSGYNLVALVGDSEEAPLVGVVLGSSTNDDRFQDFKMLSSWARQNHVWPEV